MNDNCNYQPPYTLTTAILNLVAQISKTLERLSAIMGSATEHKPHRFRSTY